MDFRVSREAFLRVLTHVSSIVDSRSTIPILSNIYIKCDNNKIEIRSTDMDISVVEKLDCNVIENGSTTLNSQIFLGASPPRPPNIYFFCITITFINH